MLSKPSEDVLSPIRTIYFFNAITKVFERLLLCVSATTTQFLDLIDNSISIGDSILST